MVNESEFGRDLKVVLGTETGRRVLMTVLRCCYVDSVLVPQDLNTNKMMWLEGRRSIGMELLGELRRLDNGLDLELAMRKEARASPAGDVRDDVYDKTVQ